MKRFKKFIKRKDAANWISLGTAICAMIITIVFSSFNYWQAAIQNERSVTPLINIYLFNGKSDGYKIQNVGEGAALTYGVKVSHKETKQTFTKWQDVTKFLGYAKEPICSDVLPNRALGKDYDRNLIEINQKPTTDTFYIGKDTPIEIETCYCSVQGQCWVSSLSGGINEVDSCNSFVATTEC